jgi:hypothetical protein
VETISGYLDKNLTDNVKRVKVLVMSLILVTERSPSGSGWIRKN